MDTKKDLNFIVGFTTKNITSDPKAWEQFLKFQAKVYKYDFANTLLIYARNKDATMVATKEQWQSLGREVHSGINGITLFKNEKITEVYDVSNTYGKEELPQLWQYEEQIPKNAVNQYIKDNYRQWKDVIVQKSFSKLDEKDIEIIKAILLNSIRKVVYNRCYLDLAFNNPLLNHLSKISDVNTLYNIGLWTQRISKLALADIEKEIKERESENERRIQQPKSERYSGNRSEYESQERNEPLGQVSFNLHGGNRPSEGVVAENTLGVLSDDVRSGDRSRETDRRIPGGMEREEPTNTTTGEGMVDQVAVDGPGESNRQGSNHSDIHLSTEIKDELSEEQEKTIIEFVLNRGSGFDKGKQRIVDFFSKENGNTERVSFLREEYGTGGGTLVFSDGSRGHQNHDSKGIRITLNDYDKEIHLKWAKVSKEIGQLIDTGKYFEPRYQGDKQQPVRKGSYQATLFNTVNEPEISDKPIENKYISQLENVFGINTTVLKRIMDNPPTDKDNINEAGRFNELLATVDNKKAKAYFEKVDGQPVPPLGLNIKTRKFFEDFILSGFEVVPGAEEINQEKDDISDDKTVPSVQFRWFDSYTHKKELSETFKLKEGYYSLIDIEDKLHDAFDIYNNTDYEEPIAVMTLYYSLDGIDKSYTFEYKINDEQLPGVINHFKQYYNNIQENNLASDRDMKLYPALIKNIEKELDTQKENAIKNITKPMGLLHWSESIHLLSENRLYPLDKLNDIILKAEKEINEDPERLGYDKTKLSIVFPVNDEQFTYQFRYDIGDNEGGIVGHFENTLESYKTGFWKEYVNTQEVQCLEQFILPYTKMLIRVPNVLQTEVKEKFNRIFEKLYLDNGPSESEPVGKEMIGDDEQPIENKVEDNNVEAEVEQASFLLQETKKEQVHVIQSHENYVIGKDFELPQGSKARFNANVKAIQTLKNIEFDQRPPTYEEQDIMAHYVGWGGIANAFDERKADWKNEYNLLKSVLDEEEYQDAKGSTLTSFYTHHDIIKQMYHGIERIGIDIEKTRILEPAMGVGNFYGCLPENINSNQLSLHGVEIDTITGKIAKQLYPNANIDITGYEKTKYPDNHFGLVVSNVPFGEYQIYDNNTRKSLLIHDYFFKKALSQTQPGGIIAFITSKGTLDKANSKIRKALSEDANFVGAVRLPNTAFKKQAGTEVTSDIIFLQKKGENVEPINQDWINISHNNEGVPMNEYFVNHPEMVLGEMVFETGMYGQTTSCINENKDFNLSVALANAMQQLPNNIVPKTLSQGIDEPEASEQEDDNVIYDNTGKYKNFTHVIINDEVYFHENYQLTKTDKEGKTKDRLVDLVKLNDSAREIIDIQLKPYYSESDFQEQLTNFNQQYDKFVKDHGYINNRGNKKAMEGDDNYYFLASLENPVEGDTKEFTKAPFFFESTVKPQYEISSVATADEALIVSMTQKGKVDIDYMASLMDIEKEEMIQELLDSNKIFINPQTSIPTNNRGYDINLKYVIAEEYLSGNVKDKLNKAKIFNNEYGNDIYQKNIKALEEVQPEPLNYTDISVRLGTVWIDESDYEKFIYETFNISRYYQAYSSYRDGSEITVQYDDMLKKYNVQNKSVDSSNPLITETYGTDRKNALYLLELALNQQFPKIYDYYIDADGKRKSIFNQKETMLAQMKQEEIKELFKEWIWKSPERQEKYEAYYNEHFNNIRLREYDGKHLTFPGISRDKKLRDNQYNGAARILYSDQSTLLAHEVGAGKTWTMQAAAMEMKRLGIANKILMTVPNHITGQFGQEFLQLYPNANILVAEPKDFKKENRKRFFAKITTGKYDAIIVGHSQFERIPLSRERKIAMMERQIEKYTQGAISADSENRFSVKQIQKMRKQLEAKLEKLLDSPKDETLTFEDMGIDALFVDEAHHFKNCQIMTKMNNIAGVSNATSMRASDMLMKVDYIHETNNFRNVVFATGTPISNSMSEMYVMQRYLQPQVLEEQGINCFDEWAAQYGEVISSMELVPEGQNYRARERFSKFTNLPELMNAFRQVADIKTADMLNLPVPKVNYIDIAVEPTPYIEEQMAGFMERAERIRAGGVDPSEDNMLKITGDARKLGTDPRLFDKDAPIEGETKLYHATKNVYDEYLKTNDDKGVHLIFSDIGTPSTEDKFTVYDHLKEQLVESGIKKDEISFIHDANNDVQRSRLFKKLRQGEQRIILGSTSKMGTGTNIQTRLATLHHIDCPWRPSDLIQQEGRILRQGNKYDEVNIYRYVTKGTFDSFMWQTVEQKQKFISQIMTGKSSARTCEDIDEKAISYSEMKAIATGDPLIKDKIDVKNQIDKLELLKGKYVTEQRRLKNDIETHLPRLIIKSENAIKGLEQLMSVRDINHNGNIEDMQVVVDGKMYEKRKEAGKAILDKLKSIHTLKAVKDDVILTVGNIMGIEMRYKSSIGIMLTLPDLKYGYTIDLSHDLVGSMMKITNKVYGIEEIISSEEQFIKNRQVQLESSKREYAKEFKHEEQLFNLKVKLNEIDKELDRRAEAVKEEKAVQSGEGHHFDDEKSNNQQSTDDEPSVKFEKAKIHFDRDKGVQAYKADNEEMER